ncbi:peptidylprolyl isomerase [Polaribacter sp.]|uniref:peptidylprolyl isomerase n=1 Tax=Polaribacter sp. TaxID=1920175 RepID=UPI003EF1FD1A
MRNSIYIFILLLSISACKTSKQNVLKDGVYAEIQTNKGNILLELYVDAVPMTVANFVSLAEGTNNKVTDSLKGKPYFDGNRFHRVVPNFIIQGGDLTETGTGGPGYKFGDEFPKNEDGQLLFKHDDAGVFSMANSGPDSNGSQFFIAHKPIPHLDGKHSVFGKTIISPILLEQLKKTHKDSIQLLKSIDSTRMVVANSIVKNDTIIAVKILRFGNEAKNYKAGATFDAEFTKFHQTVEEREAASIAADKARYEAYLKDKKEFLLKMDEGKAEKTASGLRILRIKNTKGKKVVAHKPITANYKLYLANGKLIQSTFENGAKPFTFQLNNAQRPMIAGFKEGVLTMKEGERARLFIPYYIGYGEAKFGPFPAKADLVFEVEILKIED